MQNHHRTFADCPHCGRSVITHQQQHFDRIAGTHLTQDYVGRELRFSRRAVYIPHLCDPEAVEAHSTLRVRVLEQLDGLAGSPALQAVGSADYEDAKQEAQTRLAAQNDTIREHGLLLVCPKCSAGIGQRCENLTARRRGEQAPTSQPHQERLPFPVALEDDALRVLIEETREAYGHLHEIETALNGANAIEALIALVKRDARNARQAAASTI